MAVSQSSLKAAMLAELAKQGFNVSEPHAQTAAFCDAIAKAVVEEIQKAQVVVASGSSAGSYPVT